MTNPFKAWNRDFKLLAAAVFAVGAFFGVQLGLYNNFVVSRLAIEPHELGYVEALREVPGFLQVIFIALMVRLAPSVISGVALGIMGIGIAAYATVSSIPTLALYSVIWSIGFHLWAPLEQALALAYSPPGDKGRWLGQLRSVGSIAWLASIGACMVLMDHVGYEGLFVLAGLAAVLGGVTLLFATHKVPADEHKGILLKREYALYYLLNFLGGWRKQMFITFAIFALVKVHGMPVETTLVLAFVNQFLITLSAPILGRMVDRFGERIMLSASYIGLIFVFLGYGLIEHRPTLYVLYCIDNLIFFGSIALTTYIYKIAPQRDLKPTLSMGVTMNHVAAVIAPLVGGVVWHLFGYQIIFFAGSVLAFISLVASQWVRVEERTGHDTVTSGGSDAGEC